MNQYELDQLHSTLLSILSEVDKICRENELRYTLMGGSLIGAVRHGGFIPWDDDIDIGLLNSDFLRLIEILKEINHPWLKFDYFYSTDYEEQFMKIYDSRTTLKEYSSNRIKGVFIDVFQIIPIGNTKFFSKIRFYKDAILKMSRYNQTNDSHPSTFKKIIYKFIGKVYKPSKLTQKIQKNRAKLSTKNYKYFSDPDGNVKGIVSREYFNDFIDINFERHVFMCIKDYDAYLTDVFGDYMKLPPIEQQKPGHFEILDLNKSYLEK